MSEAYRNLEEALAARGEFICPIRGVSMLPMLEQTTDAVRLVRAPERLKKYDLVLYRREDGQLVLHRVIGVRKKFYRVRGDNCERSEKVLPQQVVAVAIGYFKAGRYISCDDQQYLVLIGKTVRKGNFREMGARMRFMLHWPLSKKK